MTNEDKSLQALMLSAQAGDKRDYERLLKTIQPMIMQFLRTRVRDEQARLDVTQDVLMRIHAFRGTYDGKQKFEPWLFTITRNAMIDYFRSYGRRTDVIESRDELPMDAGEEGDAEARIAVEQALAQLTPTQRKTIEAIKIEGKTLQQVANETGSSLSAVKVRAHRAYQALFAALGKSNEKPRRRSDQDDEKKAS